MKKVFFAAILFSVFSGCINYHGEIYEKSLYRNYKKAYVAEIDNDTFNIRPLVMNELSNMGLTVSGLSEPESATHEDVIVKAKFVEGWDLAKYVKSINVQFIDAKSGTVVATGSYESGWLHGTESAVAKVFRKIKSEI